MSSGEERDAVRRRSRMESLLVWYGSAVVLAGGIGCRGGDFASVARHRSMAVCVRGSVGDGSERSGPGEIGVAAVVGGDEQFVPVRALMGDF